MNDRIRKLLELTLNGDMDIHSRKTEFDREDLFLPKTQREVKRIREYMLNQEPVLTPYSTMTGLFSFDGSVVGDAFRRGGHENFEAVKSLFYLKPLNNLVTMEWQHATADYKKVLEKGILGIVEEIDQSLLVHEKPEEKEFLEGLKVVAFALIDWAKKCSERAYELAQRVEEPQYQANLLKLSKTLLKIPAQKPDTFYEAVQAIYICFSYDPDSVGTLDRYLSPFYDKGVKEGTLTREEAKECLQELFLMLQSYTGSKNAYFTRGGESHFCVGGYLPDGSDGFCETTRLIVESLMELPTYIPQITFRWTDKTPHDVFYYMMNCERKDPHKRIAFTNDVKRIKCYTEICKIPYERAVAYTAVGCNEPAFTGAITGSNSKGNILRCVETIFHKKEHELLKAQTYEEFYSLFEKELYSDLDLIYEYDDKFNLVRGRDDNYVSSLLFNDCIENAKSLTKGGGNVVISSPMLLGLTNVIDSLITVKQFVYEEKLFTMEELVKALQSNWQGYEDMLTLIKKKGQFFGNDDDLSNGVARQFYESLYQYLKDKTNIWGYHVLVGDLVGYNEHHKWFGEATKATPDGRYSGELIKFGFGQSEGRDRNGITALLNALAQTDPQAIACGSTVTNISVDEQLVKQDDSFAKLVDLFETYFKKGGVHFQLTYVSREDLIAAKATPEEYQSLRVRVTGFSEYFVNLKESLQDDIINRTTQER